MPVIAMTRELGSLGHDIATGLAQELGLRLVTHETVERLARNTPLSNDGVLRCIEGRPTLIERLRADLRGLSLYAAEEIYDLAAAGDVVIRGWGATHLLRSVPHVLCVRVCAPLEVRAQRVMESFGYDNLELARGEVRRRDAARVAAMRRRFGADWDQGSRYDLVLNTEHVGAERCIAQIKRALESTEFQPDPESRRRMEALALAARARSALWRNPATTAYPIAVYADMNGNPGHLRIHGFVADDRQRRDAEDIVSHIEGVKSVNNEVKPLWPRFVMKSHDG
jgi:cytidylate kinase